MPKKLPFPGFDIGIFSAYVAEHKIEKLTNPKAISQAWKEIAR